MGRFSLALAMALAGVIVASLAIIAAIGFGCLSLYLYLVTVTSPPLAALFVALAALSFAIMFVALMSVMPRPSLRTLMPREYDVLGRISEAMGMGKALGTEGHDYLKSNLSGASLIAFGVGIAMGISPKLRKFVLEILKP